MNKEILNWLPNFLAISITTASLFTSESLVLLKIFTIIIATYNL